MVAKGNFLFDINTYIKADATLLSISGKSAIEIFPMVGYAESVPPIILYWYYPGIYSKDMPWFNKDMIKYTVLDNDAERLIRMGNRLQDLLSSSDSVKIPSSGSAGKWGALLRGSTHPPAAQRDGFMRYELLFEMAWVTNT